VFSRNQPDTLKREQRTLMSLPAKEPPIYNLLMEVSGSTLKREQRTSFALADVASVDNLLAAARHARRHKSRGIKQ
jgi:hypothetical protein